MRTRSLYRAGNALTALQCGDAVVGNESKKIYVSERRSSVLSEGAGRRQMGSEVFYGERAQQ